MPPIPQIRACLLALAVAWLALPPAAIAEGPAIVPQVARPDDRAALREQIKNELAQRRARLAMIEQELHKQSKRYDEMAAQKLELAKITAERAEAAKAAAAEKAIKAQYAAAKAGPKPAAKGGAAAKAKDAKDAKDPKAADAKPGAKDAASGGKDAGGAKGADAGAAKPIDPLLVQNYLVMRLREESRELRDRIAYLESVLARL